MDFTIMSYVCLVLCLFVFVEVFFSLRKNPLLKTCFLLVIASLFIMNYFSCIPVSNRFEFILIKISRVLYACSTMILVVHLATKKIPWGVLTVTILGSIFLIGIRVANFNEIDIHSTSFSTHIFSVGPELNTPQPFLRYVVYAIAIVATSLTFYYYRKFLLKMNADDINYARYFFWIVWMVVPFFLLIIFTIAGTMQIIDQSLSPYLFSLFSCTSILAILFRPKALNKMPHFQ